MIDGRSYDGAWHKGIAQGYGTMIYNSSTKYEGFF
jgi:hypothetical protein